MSAPSTDSTDSRPPDVDGTTETVPPSNEDGAVVQDMKKWLEDLARRFASTIDAVRISDGKVVVLKKIFVNLEFLEPLVEAMSQEDPTQRPSMTEVVTCIEQVASELGARRLRSRLCKKEGSMSRRMKDIKHTIVSIGYTIRRLPPTPRPRE
ncbi:hypothetical protein CERSUDRAFT_73937 [Gelatoporia subvermispora B]|uniref:Uncharacterized protein n=1 Tax=Ceriporiopsis subvermispora (strain B) TaxID=914234 RepID=M2PKW2_CERS8|nr:hypothetical protein CERSUDRAFT_73937 [Gelatoporia subvermispora B]